MLTLAILSISGIGSILGLACIAVAQEQTLNQDSIEVKAGNKTYQLNYQMSNGGSIDSISTDTYLTMVMTITSPSNGTLELTFPRELYDALSFTEHYDLIAVLDSEISDELVVIDSSCEQTILTIPVEAGTREVGVYFSDTLNIHTHSYPEKIGLLKTIEEDGQQFTIWLITDSKKCDVSFVQEEKKIQIDIKGRDEALTSDQGYFGLSVPHDLLGGNYTVLIDGKPTSFIEDQFFTKSNTDIGVQSAIQDDFTPTKASHLSFNYSKVATAIDIIGTATVSHLIGTFDYLAVPSLHDHAGENINSVEVGQQSMIGLSVHNNTPTEQPFVIVVEIRDGNDVTTDLFWQNGLLKANSNYSMGTSWTPRAEGINYQITSFALTDFNDPQFLSANSFREGINVVQPPLYQFCCTKLADNTRIGIIMNTTYSFEYSLDSGSISNIQANFDTLSMLLTFEGVSTDRYLTLKLPTPLMQMFFPDEQTVDLEQLEDKILLFIDGVQPQDYEIVGDSKNNIVTIALPIPAESQELEIIRDIIVN